MGVKITSGSGGVANPQIPGSLGGQDGGVKDGAPTPPPTVYTANEFYNNVTGEINNAIVDSGQTIDGNDYTQLSQAIQSQGGVLVATPQIDPSVDTQTISKNKLITLTPFSGVSTHANTRIFFTVNAGVEQSIDLGAVEQFVVADLITVTTSDVVTLQPVYVDNLGNVSQKGTLNSVTINANLITTPTLVFNGSDINNALKQNNITIDAFSQTGLGSSAANIKYFIVNGGSLIKLLNPSPLNNSIDVIIDNVQESTSYQIRAKWVDDQGNESAFSNTINLTTAVSFFIIKTTFQNAGNEQVISNSTTSFNNPDQELQLSDSRKIIYSADTPTTSNAQSALLSLSNNTTNEEDTDTVNLSTLYGDTIDFVIDKLDDDQFYAVKKKGTVNLILRKYTTTATTIGVTAEKDISGGSSITGGNVYGGVYDSTNKHFYYIHYISSTSLEVHPIDISVGVAGATKLTKYNVTVAVNIVGGLYKREEIGRGFIKIVNSTMLLFSQFGCQIIKLNPTGATVGAVLSASSPGASTVNTVVNYSVLEGENKILARSYNSASNCSQTTLAVHSYNPTTLDITGTPDFPAVVYNHVNNGNLANYSAMILAKNDNKHQGVFTYRQQAVFANIECVTFSIDLGGSAINFDTPTDLTGDFNSGGATSFLYPKFTTTGDNKFNLFYLGTSLIKTSLSYFT